MLIKHTSRQIIEEKAEKLDKKKVPAEAKTIIKKKSSWLTKIINFGCLAVLVILLIFSYWSYQQYKKHENKINTGLEKGRELKNDAANAKEEYEDAKEKIDSIYETSEKINEKLDE